jgi:cell division protein FtsN
MRHGHVVEEVRYAAVDKHHHGRGAAPVELAEAPEPRARSVRVAYASPGPHHGGIHLIEQAVASEPVGHHVGGSHWAIQVGAYGNANQAHSAAGAARAAAGHAQVMVASVKSGHATLYRARLSGMTHEAAIHACQKLSHKGGCTVVAPSA